MTKRVVTWGAAVCLAAGCTFFQKSPADRAADTERLQCEQDESPQADAQLLQSARVLFVQPTYSYTGGGITKVTATRIGLRPPDGFTPDRLTRVLQCHGARAFLRRVDPALLHDDPYFLPDAYVSIDVALQNGNYVAELTADTVANNLRILKRANDFAAAQRATATAPRSGP
jgi:hypothetical protein